ncbi:hypothetical protein BU16DRAFT_621050 [Lophium mytilinum]|uniref:DUF7730 domain-containing protein n=1 Tax=Lophium mytilinum TaxID=390894 RepID=A0A6A6QHF1_9PEZI|nr:hypothetical protein BU16DRAFT_621050 [Lophium mytilinum]
MSRVLESPTSPPHGTNFKEKYDEIKRENAEKQQRWLSRMPLRRSEEEPCLATLHINGLVLRGEPGDAHRLAHVDNSSRSTLRVIYGYTSSPRSRSRRRYGLLSLPKTCRLAYAESIREFYSLNTFSTIHHGALLLLPSFLAPQLFHAIRSLRLHCHVRRIYYTHPFPDSVPNDEATWESTWAVVAGMRGLRSLRVHITRPTDSTVPYRDHSIERQLLEPLAAIQGLDSFVVATSWVLDQKTPVAYRDRAWPFEIQRGVCA